MFAVPRRTLFASLLCFFLFGAALYLAALFFEERGTTENERVNAALETLVSATGEEEIDAAIEVLNKSAKDIFTAEEITFHTEPD